MFSKPSYFWKGSGSQAILTICIYLDNFGAEKDVEEPVSQLQFMPLSQSDKIMQD